MCSHLNSSLQFLSKLVICGWGIDALLFQYELLFCVEDKSDPAVMVVMQLMDEYPTVSSRLFTGQFDALLFLLKH